MDLVLTHRPDDDRQTDVAAIHEFASACDAPSRRRHNDDPGLRVAVTRRGLGPPGCGVARPKPCAVNPEAARVVLPCTGRVAWHPTTLARIHQPPPGRTVLLRHNKRTVDKFGASDPAHDAHHATRAIWPSRSGTRERSDVSAEPVEHFRAGGRAKTCRSRVGFAVAGVC